MTLSHSTTFFEATTVMGKQLRYSRDQCPKRWAVARLAVSRLPLCCTPVCDLHNFITVAR